MAIWSQSPFLQALGWAMLNSFWQMALLFIGFSVFQYSIPLSSQRKYYLALSGLGVGFSWFIYTFFAFYSNGALGTIVTQHTAAPTSKTWDLILSSASVAYFVLLLVPAYKLFKNWRYIEYLKKFGLQKTAIEYRLFVKKIAHSLAIKQTVRVYISQMVQSPVTIGYLKPIILLPIAALNNLSAQQVEAVLLHELSHIKRYDYLINFIVTLLQTVFYFNPFVKKFASLIEFEREKCCDELVMQFEYDKISYASALLQLEKNLFYSEKLALAAAKKDHLLNRIEKIVGLEKKVRFTFQQFAGLTMSFLIVLFINSLFFVNKDIKAATGQTFTAFENPLYQFDAPLQETFSKPHYTVKVKASSKSSRLTTPFQKTASLKAVTTPELFQLIDNDITSVAYDASDDLITPEEKAQIVQTLETTKNVLSKTKWKEVEASIGDGMTPSEKQVAKYEYQQALDKIDWKKLESHLKSAYKALDWTEITGKLNKAVADIKLDSLETTYQNILVQIQKAQSSKECKVILPVPDATIQEVNLLRNNLQAKIDSINAIRQFKIVDF